MIRDNEHDSFADFINEMETMEQPVCNIENIKMIVKRAEVDWPFMMAMIRVIVIDCRVHDVVGMRFTISFETCNCKGPNNPCDTIVRFDTTIVTDQRTLVDTLVDS